VSYLQEESDNIEKMLADLQNNVLSAIVLVMIVVVAALGLRSGLLVGLAVPGSFLTGILVLWLLGLSINIVVLFSLILAVGMLVDGAIVVTEYADCRMAEGLEPRAAYLQAAKRMAWPITAATATTLAAFMPLLFWPGLVGEFMKFLPITLLATLIASLLMALIFVPNVGAWIGSAATAGPRAGAASDQGDLAESSGMSGAYVWLLRRLVRRPLLVLAAALLRIVVVGLDHRDRQRGRVAGIVPGERGVLQRWRDRKPGLAELRAVGGRLRPELAARLVHRPRHPQRVVLDFFVLFVLQDDDTSRPGNPQRREVLGDLGVLVIDRHALDPRQLQPHAPRQRVGDDDMDRARAHRARTAQHPDELQHVLAEVEDDDVIA
jgi:hypothetical protein